MKEGGLAAAYPGHLVHCRLRSACLAELKKRDDLASFQKEVHHFLSFLTKGDVVQLASRS